MDRWMLSVQGLMLAADCSRLSPERGSPECEQQGTQAMGVLVVVAVVLLVAGWLLWRWKGRQLERARERDVGPGR